MRYRTSVPFILLFLAALLAACRNEPNMSDAPQAAPTINPFFLDEQVSNSAQPLGADAEPVQLSATRPPGTAAPGEEAENNASPSPDLTSTPTVTPAPTRVLTPTRIVTHTIFNERLDPNWTIDNSRWVTATRQAETYHTGQYALQFTPYEDFGSFFLTVREDATRTYPRPQVLGVRFWLNGGEHGIRLEDLALSVVGSNEYPYWVPGDYSVQSRIQPTFSETRLSFLNLNRPIPPQTWVRVDLWLNELIYDPPYRYVTGFYIKNDRGVLHPFYVDEVSLIMVEDDV